MFLVCQLIQFVSMFDAVFVFHHLEFSSSFIQGVEQAKPFIVSIWCGDSKPANINEFLHEFVNELNDILAGGFIVNGFLINVKTHCFVADSPARAFLKGIWDNRYNAILNILIILRIPLRYGKL